MSMHGSNSSSRLKVYYDLSGGATPQKNWMQLQAALMGRQFDVVDFFSGCGGLDLGFKEAGFEVVVANDSWKVAAESFKKNHPNAEFLHKDIRHISEREIKEALRKKGAKKLTAIADKWEISLGL